MKPQSAGIAIELHDLPSPPEKARFHSGLPFDLTDAKALMSTTYCHVIGILGSPGAGKTAALVSLYLLASTAKLAGFEFAQSLTTMAFERLARGARRWNDGKMPEEMTGHTQLADTRDAGLLHLRLRRRAARDAIDLLLPDLPGEWTDTFTEKGPSPRIDFLKSADAFWLFIDGATVASATTRGLVEHRIKLLIDRVGELRSQPCPPLFLVVTRKDKYDRLPPTFCENVARSAADRLVPFAIAEVASFSERAPLDPGSGLAELIAGTVSNLASAAPARAPILTSGRHILRYRASL